MSGSEDFSVPDLASADRKIQMTAKENKFQASVKYVILFLKILCNSIGCESRTVLKFTDREEHLVNKTSLMKSILMQSRSDLELGIQTFSLKLCKFVHECNSCTCIINV